MRTSDRLITPIRTWTLVRMNAFAFVPYWDFEWTVATPMAYHTTLRINVKAGTHAFSTHPFASSTTPWQTHTRYIRRHAPYRDVSLTPIQPVRVAIGLQLGLEICAPHQCYCRAQVDEYDRHGFVCKKAMGRSIRQHAPNDLAAHTLSAADILSSKELQALQFLRAKNSGTGFSGSWGNMRVCQKTDNCDVPVKWCTTLPR